MAIDVLAVMDRDAANANAWRIESRMFDDNLPELMARRAASTEASGAVAELIEAAQLRVDWTNGTWYVLQASGAAWSNQGHADEASARAEAAEALRAALANVGVAA